MKKGNKKTLKTTKTPCRKLKVVLGCVSVSVCVCVLGLEAFGADHGGEQGPHVEDETDPAGRHLDPEHRPTAIQQLLYLMVVIATGKQT